MTIERKYRKQLNRNGWMRKIQLYVWGRKVPDFVGYCPFFWFTWLSLLVAIPATLIFIAVLPFIGLAALIKKLPDRPSRPSHFRLIEIYEAVEQIGFNYAEYEEHSKMLCHEANWAKWICLTPDWWNCVLAAHAKEERRILRQCERDNRDKRNLSKVANNLHHLVRPLAWLVFCAVMFWLGRMIGHIWLLIYWPKVGEVLIMIILIASGIAVLVGIVLLIGHAWDFYRSKCPRCPEKVGFWRKLGNGLLIPLEFLFETVDAIYTRECPLIEWSDESAPIEEIDHGGF